MTSELPFPGFHEYIATPLATTDERSFSLIRRFFIEQPQLPSQPFSLLITKLTGKKMANPEAVVCWQQIVKHKIRLQQKLGRIVGIQTAAIDYFEYQSPIEPHFRQAEKQPVALPNTIPANRKISSPDYHLEKLKEEILRSKRYRHALSIILLDIDNFHEINARLGYEEGDKVLVTIVQIIKKCIRNVDFLSRMSGDRFLIILPNTNQREARELAERIRIQIVERTSRLKNISGGMTSTLSVGQCIDADSSITFIRRLEHTLDLGKQKNRNTVYTTA